MERRSQSLSRSCLSRRQTHREVGLGQRSGNERERISKNFETHSRTARGEQPLKIKSVQYNNRRKVFTLDTEKGEMEFPYTCAEPRPVQGNYVREAYVDPELGEEGFSYRLQSGEEGSVHGDSVLEQNQDPDYLSELMLYNLTLALRQTIEESPLSKREIIRKSKISPPQFYRLINPANSRKSAGQIFRILYALNHDVEFSIRERKSTTGTKVGENGRYAVSVKGSQVLK